MTIEEKKKAEEIDIRKKAMIIEDKGVAKAIYSMSDYETKIMKAIQAQILKNQENPDIARIDAKQLIKYCNITAKDAIKRLDKVTDKLMTRFIRIKKKNEDGTIEYTKKMHFVDFIETIEDKNKHEMYICFKINDEVMQYLYKKGKNFKPINGEELQKLNTYYSIRIYELCCLFLDEGKNEALTRLDIDEIRVMFEIDDMEGVNIKKGYKSFSNIKQKIIDPAIEAINDRTDIKVTPDYEKKGKKVIAVYFNVKRKEKNITPKKEDDKKAITEAKTMLSMPEDVQKAFERLLFFGVEFNEAVNYVNTKSVEYINVACDKYSAKKSNGENIKVGLLITYLNNGSAWNEYLYKKEQGELENKKAIEKKEKNKEIDNNRPEEEMLSEFALQTYFNDPEGSSSNSFREYIKKHNLSDEYLFEFAKSHSYFNAIKVYKKKNGIE